MNALFITFYVLSFLYLFIFVPYYIIRQIRSGKVKPPTSYSYKAVFKIFFQAILIVTLISLLIFYFSESIEVTICLGLFFSACVFAGAVKQLFIEKVKKDRGLKRVD